MPNRSFSYQTGSSYRFGFNGQSKDNEVYGAGNLNTALFWEYDTRLGRRWNFDPKPTANESQYATNRNNPIRYNDPLGDTPGSGDEDVMPSPAGLLYEAFYGMNNSIFNLMSFVGEELGYGKPGVSIRKEIKYGENGEILGNEVVEKPRLSGWKKAASVGLDAISAIPSKPNTQALGLLFAKPVLYRQSVVQVVRFIQGAGDKARPIIVKLPPGFKEVVSNGKSQVFSNGKVFISPDLDGHLGGIWKMADKEKNLWRKDTRIGTYNEDLSKKIGK